VRQLGVERVVDELLAVVTTDDLEVVLHAGALRHLRGDVPEVCVRDPAQAQRVRKAHHAVAYGDLVGLTAPEERRARTLVDRGPVALDEPVDPCGVEGPAIHQPVDREPAAGAGRAAGDGGHGSPPTVPTVP
jgi:hypothetical protein